MKKSTVFISLLLSRETYSVTRKKTPLGARWCEISVCVTVALALASSLAQGNSLQALLTFATTPDTVQTEPNRPLSSFPRAFGTSIRKQKNLSKQARHSWESRRHASHVLLGLSALASYWHRFAAILSPPPPRDDCFVCMPLCSLQTFPIQLACSITWWETPLAEE